MNALTPEGPRLERFLVGTSRVSGLFQDFTGKVRRRFVVDLQGRIENGALVLTEDFQFDDGETERRLWRIWPVGDAGYAAEAGGMIGQARGGLAGGVLYLSYLFSLRIGRRHLRVRFHDSFVQLSDDEILNIGRVKKFGFEIGRTIIVFHRGV